MSPRPGRVVLDQPLGVLRAPAAPTSRRSAPIPHVRRHRPRRARAAIAEEITDDQRSTRPDRIERRAADRLDRRDRHRRRPARPARPRGGRRAAHRAAALAGGVPARPAHHPDPAGRLRSHASASSRRPTRCRADSTTSTPRSSCSTAATTRSASATAASGTSYNNRWHTDVTFSATPPLASILAAKEMPAAGGDTLWADLVAAYATLSPGLQRLVDPLVAVHDAAPTFDRFQADDGQPGAVAALAPGAPPGRARAPRDRRARACSSTRSFTSHIEGLSRLESERLLRCSTSTSPRPSTSCAGAGAPATSRSGTTGRRAHYAAADYDGPRVMHRITVAGDRPYGVGQIWSPRFSISRTWVTR